MTPQTANDYTALKPGGLLEQLELRAEVESSKRLDVAQLTRTFGRNLPFRGLLKPVTPNDPLPGLNWNVTEQALTRADGHDVPAYKALVRDDTGQTLAVTSRDFRPHQNAQIFSTMNELAAAGDATIAYAGPLDDGRRVAAVAFLSGEFGLPDKRENSYWNDHAGARKPTDRTALALIISGGHEPGTPLKVRGMAFRLWCANGAFFTVDSRAGYRLTHASRLTAANRDEMKRAVEAIRNEFEAYGETAAKLQAVDVEREASRVYVAELLKPGFTRELAVRMAGEGLLTGLQADVETPGLLPLTLAAANKHPEATANLLDLLAEAEEGRSNQRTAGALLNAIANQEGANGANLWSAYNGITYHVDHVRGRSVATGVEASLFGTGAKLKEQALETARAFVGEF